MSLYFQSYWKNFKPKILILAQVLLHERFSENQNLAQVLLLEILRFCSRRKHLFLRFYACF